MSELPDIRRGIHPAVLGRPFTDSYSRFVTMAKRLLPLLALGLLILVALWPRLDIGLGHLGAFAKIDPRQAHDLRMLHARYTGVDRDNRPFIVTADAAEQLSTDINDMIGLEGPKADVTSAQGSWYEVNSYTGTYQPQTRMLNMFGNVSLFGDRGDEFHSDSAKIDLGHSTAQSDDPVTGQGPFGHVTAAGFRVLDRGATIIFTGHTELELAPHAAKAAQ
jgi:lipopolysaccharide export system protein LptC